MSPPEKNSVRPSSLSSSLLLGITFLSPLKLLGAEQPVQPVQPAPAQPEQSSGLFDSIDVQRDYLSGKIISFATDIDRFFGNDRNYQESNKTVMQLAIARATGYGGDRKFVLSARANLNLPSTEKRLHLLLESNPDQNITGEPTPIQNTPLPIRLPRPRVMAWLCAMRR